MDKRLWVSWRWCSTIQHVRFLTTIWRRAAGSTIILLVVLVSCASGQAIPLEPMFAHSRSMLGFDFEGVPNSDTILVVASDRASLLGLRGEVLDEKPLNVHYVHRLTFSKDGTHWAAMAHSTKKHRNAVLHGEIEQNRLEEVQLIDLGLDDYPILESSAHLSPAGNRLLTIDYSGKWQLQVWDTSTNKVLIERAYQEKNHGQKPAGNILDLSSGERADIVSFLDEDTVLFARPNKNGSSTFVKLNVLDNSEELIGKELPFFVRAFAIRDDNSIVGVGESLDRAHSSIFVMDHRTGEGNVLRQSNSSHFIGPLFHHRSMKSIFLHTTASKFPTVVTGRPAEAEIIYLSGDRLASFGNRPCTDTLHSSVVVSHAQRQRVYWLKPEEASIYSYPLAQEQSSSSNRPQIEVFSCQRPETGTWIFDPQELLLVSSLRAKMSLFGKHHEYIAVGHKSNVTTTAREETIIGYRLK